MKLKLDFNLILGESITSIPEPVIKMGAVQHFPPPQRKEHPVIRIPQSILLHCENGVWTGIYTHPHWGKSQAINVSVSDNHIAFSALSGNDDKGGAPVYFNFALARTDATDSVVGFCGGQAPFFRSFLPVEGIISEYTD